MILKGERVDGSGTMAREDRLNFGKTADPIADLLRNGRRGREAVDDESNSNVDLLEDFLEQQSQEQESIE